MLLSNCGPGVTRADVAAFERRLGITLPAPYTRFLLDVNGGEGPVEDDSEYPPAQFFSLHWLGGPVDEADVAAFYADPFGWWHPAIYRDLEMSVRGLWGSGLARTWLPIANVHHECLLLIRLSDGTVWEMVAIDNFDGDICSRVAASFDELDVRAIPS